jgi:hypothetical protein
MGSGDSGPVRVGGRRRIGPHGTAARVSVAAVFLAPVAAGRFDPKDVVVGLVVFPTILLGWQGWRARRTPAESAIRRAERAGRERWAGVNLRE